MLSQKAQKLLTKRTGGEGIGYFGLAVLVGRKKNAGNNVGHLTAYRGKEQRIKIASLEDV